MIDWSKVPLIISLIFAVGMMVWAVKPRRRYKGLVRVVLMQSGAYAGKYTYQYRNIGPGPFYRRSEWLYSGEYYDYQNKAEYAAADKLRELQPKKPPKPFIVVDQ